MGATPGATLAEQVGIEVAGGEFEKLLDRDTSLPAKQTKTFTTADDNQRTVQVRVFQGSHESAAENHFLGEATVSGIPPAPAGVPDLEVTLRVETDGSMQISAGDDSGDTPHLEMTGAEDVDDAAVHRSESGDAILAIDFGTTNSVCAVMEDGHPEIVGEGDSERSTPTAFAVADDGTPLFGSAAKKQAINHPSRTVKSVKRTLFETDGPIDLSGESYAPEEIAGRFLGKLRADAEQTLGRRIEKAVVIVPASCSVRQRNRVHRAGSIAGLSIERTITDTAAAVMGAGLPDNSPRTVLAYDLGGGTLSVSVMRIENGVYEIVGSSGDSALGGDDWDWMIADYLLDEFEAEHGIDLRGDPQARQRVTNAAERAKIELTSRSRTRVEVPALTTTDTGPLDLDTTLTRSTFESLSEELVERLLGPTSQALSEASCTEDDIDDVLLVGGSGRLPAVRDRIEGLIGQAPTAGVHPQETVALGAGVQAGVLEGSVDDVVVLDVTSRSIGVEVDGGLLERIVERNTTIPTVESKTVTTTTDGQDRVPIRVFHGDRELAADNELLAEFALDIPSADAEPHQIEVEIAINEDRLLRIEATHGDTSVQRRISPDTELPLTDDAAIGELAAPRVLSQPDEAAEPDASPEELRQELIGTTLDVRNQLHRGVLYCRGSIDNRLPDIADNLEKTAETIESVVHDARAVDDRNSDDGRQIGELHDILEDAHQTLAAALDDDRLRSWTLRDLESLIDDVDRALQAMGLRLIDPGGGAETDPYRHQVLSSTDSTLPEGRIASVQQIGYELDGEVKREAKVIVSARDSSSNEQRIGANGTDSVQGDRSASATESDDRATEDHTAETTTGDATLDETRLEEQAPPVEQYASPPRKSLRPGDFEFEDQIGAGGQATVNRARLPDVDGLSRVAVKRFNPEGGTVTDLSSILTPARMWREVDSNEREGRRWRSHEYVVGIVDINEQLGWLTMEYMDGEDLSERLAETTTGLPLDEAVWIAQCLCRALVIAHEISVVHLDIKPGNVLFAETDPQYWDLPKLADWGLAQRLRDDSENVDGFTRSYAAPEQVESDTYGDPDTLTDVYQVGAVLYAMLTGEPPSGEDRLTKLDEEPPPPSEYRDEVPSALDEVVLTALSPSKIDRQESVRYLRDDLASLWD